jgi:DNA-binding MarR family transcriptional regulator
VAEDPASPFPTIGDEASWFAVRERNLRLVHYVRNARHLREQFFEADLFADPAWDMLLDLYEAELSEQRTTVSNLCIASRVPATTALRWLRTLERRRLVDRTPDANDGRRKFLTLSDTALTSLNALFEAFALQTSKLQQSP